MRNWRTRPARPNSPGSAWAPRSGSRPVTHAAPLDDGAAVHHHVQPRSRTRRRRPRRRRRAGTTRPGPDRDGLVGDVAGQRRSRRKRRRRRPGTGRPPAGRSAVSPWTSCGVRVHRDDPLARCCRNRATPYAARAGLSRRPTTAQVPAEHAAYDSRSSSAGWAVTAGRGAVGPAGGAPARRVEGVAAVDDALVADHAAERDGSMSRNSCHSVSSSTTSAPRGLQRRGGVGSVGNMRRALSIASRVVDRDLRALQLIWPATLGRGSRGRRRSSA